MEKVITEPFLTKRQYGWIILWIVYDPMMDHIMLDHIMDVLWSMVWIIL